MNKENDNDNIDQCRHCPECRHYVRLPGAFRRWEIEPIIEQTDEFHVTAARVAADGTLLFTVYCREPLPGPGGRP
jgi:hypothetical protein